MRGVMPFLFFALLVSLLVALLRPAAEPASAPSVQQTKPIPHLVAGETEALRPLDAPAPVGLTPSARLHERYRAWLS